MKYLVILMLALAGCTARVQVSGRSHSHYYPDETWAFTFRTHLGHVRIVYGYDALDCHHKMRRVYEQGFRILVPCYRV